MMRHSLIRSKCQQSRLWRPCFTTLSSSKSVDVVLDICFGVTFQTSVFATLQYRIWFRFANRSLTFSQEI